MNRYHVTCKINLLPVDFGVIEASNEEAAIERAKDIWPLHTLHNITSKNAPKNISENAMKIAKFTVVKEPTKE